MEKQVSDPWKHVKFRVNAFTYDEWPMHDPESFDDFSIGEEQSNCTVIALQWSPTGLGKHRRPVLAVHTSNLLVSFWQFGSDPSDGASWQRVLVVNNAVKRSLEKRCQSENLLTQTQNCRRLRIRAIAWTPKACESRRGVFLLAVTNDSAEILILSVTSPYIDHSNSWDSKVIKIIQVSDKGPQSDEATRARNASENGVLEHNAKTPENGRDLAASSLFKIALGKKRFVDTVSWGPLNLLPNEETILSLIYNGVVFHCLLSISFLFPVNTCVSNVPRLRFECKGSYKDSYFNPYSSVAAWYRHVSTRPSYSPDFLEN